ncbi:MAG TPA: hypothetical protein VNS58_17970 [Puia sp.]|nr:hypothetical protein [Puia sp.]
MKLLKKTKPSGLGLLLTPVERDRLIQDMSVTTCRSFSEYARKKIFGKPVTVYYRDRSYDEFTEAYIEFKRDMDRLLGKDTLSANEKEWLKERVEGISDVVAKLYDHVRETRKGRPHH